METDCKCQHHQILREAKAERIAADLIRYPLDPPDYAERVRELEAEGLPRTDADYIVRTAVDAAGRFLVYELVQDFHSRMDRARRNRRNRAGLMRDFSGSNINRR